MDENESRLNLNRSLERRTGQLARPSKRLWVKEDDRLLRTPKRSVDGRMGEREREREGGRERGLGEPWRWRQRLEARRRERARRFRFVSFRFARARLVRPCSPQSNIYAVVCQAAGCSSLTYIPIYRPRSFKFAHQWTLPTLTAATSPRLRLHRLAYTRQNISLIIYTHIDDQLEVR